MKRSKNEWLEASLRAAHWIHVGDSVTGAPVIELGYTYWLHTVPNEGNMVTYCQTGVAPRRATTRPQDNGLGGEFFYCPNLDSLRSENKNAYKKVYKVVEIPVHFIVQYWHFQYRGMGVFYRIKFNRS